MGRFSNKRGPPQKKMPSRVSFSVRPLALPISIKWILFISWGGEKLINNFFPYKPSAMADRVSFSVRPPASPTYPIHLINLYEQPRTWSTIFDNTKRPFFRHHPFPWKHSQKPIAYTLAYALVALPTNSILSIHKKKKKNISSPTNYQQWPFAYLLAYIHLPHQLIKYYHYFQNWAEKNNHICFHQKQLCF